MLECSVDAEYFIEFEDNLVTSKGTQFCLECKRLIPAGEEHYRLQEWMHGEYYDDRIYKKVRICCEECGDLALSWMELGYCWSYGDLRGNIAEMNE